MEKRGQISLFWLIIIFLIIVPMVMNISIERRALADDIKTGKLVLTQISRQMILKGDALLQEATQHNGYRCPTEYSLYAAFVAKVWYERARLEMEAE